jgi:hypothetical protein
LGSFRTFAAVARIRGTVALVEAEVEVFGQRARVRVDPLDVKRVG